MTLAGFLRFSVLDTEFSRAVNVFGVKLWVRLPLRHIGLFRVVRKSCRSNKLNFYLTCIGAFATVVASRKVSGKRATYAIVWSPLYFSPNSLSPLFSWCRIHLALRGSTN